MVMVHDAERPDMVELGKKYKQNSVLFSDYGENQLIQTTGDRADEVVMDGHGYEFIPEAENYYTELTIADKALRFALELNEVPKKEKANA